ncbi:MAG: hypothetical protein HGB12_13110 [Bacteroidetes bacterium]|nr:hypothetical protein [Bacteroidota bacterium]
MKRNLIITFAVIFCFSIQLKTYSQGSAMFGIYSGYGRTLYNMDGYKSTSFSPVGVRASIGTWGIQLGVDCNTNISNPMFSFNGPYTGKNDSTITIKDSYLGVMLRFPMADDVKNFEVILRGGAGMYLSKKEVQYSSTYILNQGFSNYTQKFKDSFACNVALGFSFPLGEILDSRLHFNLEGQYNYNERKYYGHKNFHTSWCVQAGLTYNIIDY